MNLIKNLKIISERYPSLHKQLLQNVDFDKVTVEPASDGGIFYSLKTQHSPMPLSDPVSPLKKANTALKAMASRLENSLAPAVIVGLYPGFLLEIIYKLFKDIEEKKGCFRDIYVIVDNLNCFAAWLKAADRESILSQEKILFVDSENIHQIVRLCESDMRSHLFIPVSVLPQSELDRIISPLAELYLRRQTEEVTWRKENNEYYDSITDQRLAQIISGHAGRKPRLLMPAHSTSTVVQYSARDTCKAFELAGWETRILKMYTDSPSWRTIKEIRDFKPDIFLFINHLRTEDDNIDLYPRNLMFITWVQDAVPQINRRDSAEKWNRNALKNRRDLIVGYVEQLERYEYLPERLTRIQMRVDPYAGRNISMMPTCKTKYSCDVCFASNRGKPTDRILEEDLLPYMEKFSFSRETIFLIHDLLWEKYRKGESLINYLELEAFLKGIKGFSGSYFRLSQDQRDNLIEKIFWLLNDVIYRHSVLEWCDEFGLNLNIYGKGWENHPVFSKYFQGEIKHGEELRKAYSCAGYCLHLNSMEGIHQRLFEILFSSGQVLMRTRDNLYIERKFKYAKAYRNLFRQMVPSNRVEIDGQATKIINEKFFIWVQEALSSALDTSPEDLHNLCLKALNDDIMNFDLTFFFPENALTVFSNKEELADVLKKKPKPLCAPDLNDDADFGLIKKIHDFQTLHILQAAALNLLGKKSSYIISFQPDKAIIDFSALLSIGSTRPDKLLSDYFQLTFPGNNLSLFLVKRLLQWKRKDEALDIFVSVNKEELLERYDILLYAEILLMLNRRDEAILFLKEKYRKYPALNNLFVQLSHQYYFVCRKYKDAVCLAEHDLKLKRIAVPYWMQRYSIILAACGRVDEACEIALQCAAMSGGVGKNNIYCFPALGAYLNGDFKKSLELFKRDEKANLADCKYLVNYAACAFLCGDYKKAFEIASHIKSEYKVLGGVFSAYIDFNGKNAINIDYDIVLDLLEKISFEEKIADSNIYLYYIQAYAETRNYEKLQEKYNESLKIHPDKKDRINIFAAFYLIFNDNAERATELLEKLKIDNASGYELFIASLCFAMTDKLTESICCLEKLYSVAPFFFLTGDLTTARYILFYGLIAFKCGRMALTDKCFEYSKTKSNAYFYYKDLIDDTLSGELRVKADLPDFPRPWN